MKKIVLKIEKLYLEKKVKFYLNYIKNYNLDKINNLDDLIIKLKDKELLNNTNNFIKILNKFNKFNLNPRKILIIYLLTNFTSNFIENINEIDKHMLYWCNEILNIINNINNNINIDKYLVIFSKYDNTVNTWLLMDKNRLVERTIIELKQNKDLIIKLENLDDKKELLDSAYYYQNILMNELKKLNIIININEIDKLVEDYNNKYKSITTSIKYNYLLVFVKRLKYEIKKDNREIIYLNLLEINDKLKNNLKMDTNKLREIVLDDNLLLDYLINLSKHFKLNIVFDKPENYIPEIIIKINYSL